MATKPQAKTAIDNTVTLIKTDIDNIIPTSPAPNIKDGNISFGPSRWQIILDAGGVGTTADSWFVNIQANLTTAGRIFTVDRSGRRLTGGGEIKYYRIDTVLASYLITNMG